MRHISADKLTSDIMGASDRTEMDAAMIRLIKLYGGVILHPVASRVYDPAQMTDIIAAINTCAVALDMDNQTRDKFMRSGIRVVDYVDGAFMQTGEV